MILRVGIRGNGEQLAGYLAALKDNDHVQILDVDGDETADNLLLQQTILEMQLNAELTKTDKAFFHTQINPAYGEDQAMTREDWNKAADILAKEVGYENQRRVIVLHTKKGRTHAHVVWERYNHDTGKMIVDKHRIFKANNARSKIEQALGHKMTRERNPFKQELKTDITDIWNKSSNGPQFVNNMRKAGYIVAAGTGNRPFMVVDKNGISYNLVRQIEGANTSAVRKLLRDEPLMTDKQAIELMREAQNSGGKREQQEIAHKPEFTAKAKGFAENRVDITPEDPAEINKRKVETSFKEFQQETKPITQPLPPKKDEAQERKKAVAAQFAENALSGKATPEERDAAKQKLIDEQQRSREMKRKRGPQR